ncbi:MAG: hypothetical protein ACOYVG_03670 [Bacteroidota bacterium]
MKKITLLAMFFTAGLVGLSSYCNGQSTAAKTKTNAAVCSHCGKSSCHKNCSSSSETKKNISTMQNKTLPSCTLNEKQFSERADSLTKTIFSKAKTIKPLKDGYDIIFTEPKEFSLELIELVNFERNCCSDFTWALVFEPNNKATHLQVYGSQKVKNEMRNVFKSFGLDRLIN